MIPDPSSTRVLEDIDDVNFQFGCWTGRWRVIAFAFPMLDFAISAVEPDGSGSEYCFRAELSNYPGQAPLVRIWDHEANGPLAVEKRPKGGPRVERTFQHWASDTVYRPWDRETGPHGENANKFPHAAWHANRRLTFIMEDLHAILNANARALPRRASA